MLYYHALHQCQSLTSFFEYIIPTQASFNTDKKGYINISYTNVYLFLDAEILFESGLKK